METLKKAWKNEYIQTGIMIVLIIGVVFGFWYGTQLILNTRYPALAVASESMCEVEMCARPYWRLDNYLHPFKPTLHIGDLIIVQGVPPEDIKVDEYPNGSIIVFHSLHATGELVVHRAIAKENRSGKWYFRTQGDGNPGPDPQMVPGENVEGKVVMRIPWIGRVALFMRNSSGIYIIILLIVILVIVEFIAPMVSRGKPEVLQEEDEEIFEI